jgi:serine phosphatase RsbU (regulator of sigma subunit)
MSGAAVGGAKDRRIIESLTVELLTVYEELNLLYSLTAELGSLAKEDDVAAAALREATEIAHADCSWFVVYDCSGLRIPDNCRRGIPRETAARISDVFLKSRPSQGPGIHLLLHDMGDESDGAEPHSPGRLLACSLGGDTVPAWLCLGRRAGSPIFTSADQKLLAAVAALAGIALENVRLQRNRLEQERLAGELEMARSIQQSLLPHDFQLFPWLDATGESMPCYEIGGDYFDLIPVEGEQCLLVIADVSGKGPAAALRAATVQGNIHAMSRSLVGLPQIPQTINDSFRLRSSDAASFVTAFFALLDCKGKLRYVNAGHCRPIRISTRGPLIELTEGGPLLGFFPEPQFAEGSLSLAPGDLVLFYTDGVTDAENEAGETFDLERLLTWAAGQAGRSSENVRDDLIREIASFCGSQRHPDDLTVLVVSYRGASSP